MNKNKTTTDKFERLVFKFFDIHIGWIRNALGSKIGELQASYIAAIIHIAPIAYLILKIANPIFAWPLNTMAVFVINPLISTIITTIIWIIIEAILWGLIFALIAIDLVYLFIYLDAPSEDPYTLMKVVMSYGIFVIALFTLLAGVAFLYPSRASAYAKYLDYLSLLIGFIGGLFYNPITDKWEW